jgi:hypothetical protein
MKKLSLIFLLVFTVSFFSCSVTTFYPLIKKDTKTKGDIIAVIAGTNNNETVAMAKYMTKSLMENSRLKVLGQDKITGAVAGYPLKINGPYTSAYTDVKVDYSKTDLLKIKEIQKQLGVNYIVAVWAPTGVLLKQSSSPNHPSGDAKYGMSSTKEHTIQVIVQIFEFPGCVEIGEHDRELEYCLSCTASIELSGKKTASDINDRIAEYCDYASQAIAKRMGMEK